MRKLIFFLSVFSSSLFAFTENTSLSFSFQESSFCTDKSWHPYQYLLCLEETEKELWQMWQTQMDSFQQSLVELLKAQMNESLEKKSPEMEQEKFYTLRMLSQIENYQKTFKESLTSSCYIPQKENVNHFIIHKECILDILQKELQE